MGSSSSKPKDGALAAGATGDTEGERIWREHKADVERQLHETYKEGHMAGFVEGKVAGEQANVDFLLNMAYFVVVFYSTSLAAVYFRMKSRADEAVHREAETAKAHQTELVAYRTVQQRIVDAERALEDQRVVIAQQKGELEGLRAAMQQETVRRQAAMRSAVASKRRLRAGMRTQQRLTAEVASYKMGCGIAAMVGIGVFGVMFGSKIVGMAHGHGSHSTVVVEVPHATPPAQPAAPAEKH
jgi:hypothetical protein